MENNDPNNRNYSDPLDFDAEWRDEIGQDIEAQDQSDWEDEKAQFHGELRNLRDGVIIIPDIDEEEPYDHDDMYDVDSAFGSCGWGTDEWYE